MFVVSPMPDGHVWLGVNGAIDIVDPVLGRVGQIIPDPAHPETALPKGRVQAVAIAPTGAVYIATQQGLYRSDLTGRHLKRVNVPDRGPTAAIRELCFVGDVLWLGGDLDGLWAVDLHTPDNPVVRLHEAGPRLGDARIASIDRGVANTLWVGTRKSLARVDTVSGQIERVPTDASDPTQLPGGFVSSTLTDHRGGSGWRHLVRACRCWSDGTPMAVGTSAVSVCARACPIWESTNCWKTRTATSGRRPTTAWPSLTAKALRSVRCRCRRAWACEPSSPARVR